MANLAEMFEEEADGPIIAAVIGEDNNGKKFSLSKKHPAWKDRKKHPLHSKVVTWDEARPVLDYAFENDNCHEVYVWTENSVLYVVSLDNGYSVLVHRLPRNPVPCEPSFCGE